MNAKVRYSLKFVVGIIFVILIVSLAYWLMHAFNNIIVQSLIGIFIGLPLLKTLITLPNEIRILWLVWRSDREDIEEIEEWAASLRERCKL